VEAVGFLYDIRDRGFFLPLSSSGEGKDREQHQDILGTHQLWASNGDTGE